MTIGFFDSGIGGLSVLQVAKQVLNHESFIYVADSKNSPYGNKSSDFIIARSIKICQFLIKMKVKIIVVACNTATSHAINVLRERFEIPIIGMEPGIKPALTSSISKKIAVLATPKTLSGNKFANLRSKLHGDIYPIAAPGLVELIEAGNIKTQKLQLKLRQLLKPILNHNIDRLVLGCTHYSLVSEEIKAIIGENIEIYDPTEAVVKHLKDTLIKKNLQSKNNKPSTEYYSNADNRIMADLFNIKTPIKLLNQ